MAVRLERGASALSPLRTVALGVGFTCAVAATVTIFLTDNAQLLRIGILIALWGFVFAALAAGRRQTEQAVAAGAEVELRKTYEAELEREVAARREYELRLEVQLRRELQNNFAAQVGDLREEMTRLRRELSEQWDSELRVERMVMRTQSVRMGSERRESLDQSAASLSSPATIEAAPVRDDSFDSRPGQAAPVEASSWDVTSYRPEAPRQERNGPPEANGHRDVPSSGTDEDDPSTREVPVIVTGARPYMTAPVPPLSPGATSSPAPDLPAAPPPATRHDSEDVLARVLAEAGSTAGGRRRRHRYADDDEDA